MNLKNYSTVQKKKMIDDGKCYVLNQIQKLYRKKIEILK